MKKTSLMAAMAAVVGGAVLASATAHAQTTPTEAWQPPQGEMDPAKRVPQASQPAADATLQSHTGSQPYYADSAAPASHEQGRGGFFLGAQAGKGWVYDDIDQSALMVNAGYRWQAGPVTLVGIEVAGGRVDDTVEDGWRYGKVEVFSVGANARFNFGSGNPVYGLVRSGYWVTGDNEIGDRLDGGYVGAGLGVDFNRNFNMSLVYTTHVYFENLEWTNDGVYYDASRADTLMLGAEVRF
ncbi:outer membrane beta-barrel protein [Lysobacter sp. F6437]|uniref:outer membrane beta-barrel protein n=1 Tax=Lysobacter sp. F6437 TaxID=3459296 RepID=UPI00403E2A6C